MSKWALITGAASGIGAEMAKILAHEGYSLFLVDKSEKGLQALLEYFKISHPTLKTHHILIDLTDEVAAIKLYQVVKNSNQSLDILINNAGFGTLGRFSEIDWQREKNMIRLHVETLTHLTKLFLTDMLDKGHGKILNVASVAGFQPSPLMAVYNATKAYILSFSEALANELAGSGVTVTILCPGLTRTDFQRNVGVGNPDFTKNKWFTLTPEQVAKCGISAMHKGKVIAIPGLINQLLATLHRFLPRFLVTRLMRKIQEKNRRFLAKKERPV